VAERMRRGSFAWLLLGALILAWDVLCRPGETLSESFARGCRQHRGMVRAGWLVLTLHLFGLLPKRADPLHLVCVAGKAIRDRA
jgi:hypothetical protein